RIGAGLAVRKSDWGEHDPMPDVSLRVRSRRIRGLALCHPQSEQGDRNGREQFAHHYSYGLAFFTGTVTPSFAGVLSVSRYARMSASSCSFNSTPSGGMGEIVRLSNPLASLAFGSMRLSVMYALSARTAMPSSIGPTSPPLPLTMWQDAHAATGLFWNKSSPRLASPAVTFTSFSPTPETLWMRPSSVT